MNIPMMWMAAGSVLGALFWSHVHDALLYATIWTATAIACLFLSDKKHLRPAVGLVGFGLTGINMPHSHHQLINQKHVVGTVMERQPYSVLMHTDRGLVRLHLRNPPPVGTLVTAFVQSKLHPRSLPGSYSRPEIEKRLGIPCARAIAWTTVNHKENTARTIPSEYSGIIRALATGDRSSVADSVTQKMRRTGTIHLLAISGLHIGMAATVGSLVGWVISRSLIAWPYFARVIPTLFGLMLAAYYADIVGWPTSTRRAFCMVVVIGLTRLLHRSIQPWHVWALALTVVLIFRPHHVESISLWMSFGAVAGLIAWTPMWSQISKQWSMPFRWVWQSMCASTAATVGVLPVSAWVFQEVSIGAPLSNLLAIPLFAGLAVPTSMLAVHGPQQLQPLSIWLAEKGITGALWWMDYTDFGTLHPAVGGGGALLLAFAVMLHQFPKIALLFGFAALFPRQMDSGNFKLTFPDIGQGGSALVEHADGRIWLIDGGPPGKKLLFWLRRKGIRKLDAVFLTHPDTDHLGGLVPIMESMEVSTLWAPRKPNKGETQFHNFWRLAAQRGTSLRTMTTEMGGNKNENSLVVQLRHGAHRFLLTGDIGEPTETNMLPHLQPFTVVQVPHHGSLGSSSPDFVRVTKPQFAVIQTAPNNRYGHPHPDVVERWGPHKVLRTDHHGTISFESDGYSLSLRSETGPTTETYDPFFTSTID